MESSSREQNYWPGFVDALSNVVLTLVFVLVIFVFALTIEANKVEQKVQELSETPASTEPTQSSAEEENQELKKQVMALSTELQKIQGSKNTSDVQFTGAVSQQAVTVQNQDKQITVDDNHTDVPRQGVVDVANVGNGIVLKYPLAVVDMDENSSKQLEQALGGLQKKIGAHKVIMHTIIGRETYSVARRMAYYRAVNARNFLISKMGVTLACRNYPVKCSGGFPGIWL